MPGHQGSHEGQDDTKLEKGPDFEVCRGAGCPLASVDPDASRSPARRSHATDDAGLAKLGGGKIRLQWAYMGGFSGPDSSPRDIRDTASTLAQLPDAAINSL